MAMIRSNITGLQEDRLHQLVAKGMSEEDGEEGLDFLPTGPQGQIESKGENGCLQNTKTVMQESLDLHFFFLPNTIEPKYDFIL